MDDLGRYMAQYGMSPTLGRIWGYLLLSREPVSLDRIAADLQIAKSGASVATRQLEAFQMARRSWQRGTRRVLYVATDYSNERLVDWALASYRTLAELLRAGALASTDDEVRARLEENSDLFTFLNEQLDQHLRRWREERRKS